MENNNPMSVTTATMAGDEGRPPDDRTRTDPKPRRRRRRPNPIPDWQSLARRMSYRERSELNRVHRELDTIAMKLLIRVIGGAGDPASIPAAEKLA